jgi:hypothetical protein
VSTAQANGFLNAMHGFYVLLLLFCVLQAGMFLCCQSC